MSKLYHLSGPCVGCSKLFDARETLKVLGSTGPLSRELAAAVCKACAERIEASLQKEKAGQS